MKPQGTEKSRCAEKPSSQNGYLCYCSVQSPETRLSGKVVEDKCNTHFDFRLDLPP